MISLVKIIILYLFIIFGLKSISSSIFCLKDILVLVGCYLFWTESFLYFCQTIYLWIFHLFTTLFIPENGHHCIKFFNFMPHFKVFSIHVKGFAILLIQIRYFISPRKNVGENKYFQKQISFYQFIYLVIGIHRPNYR